MNSHSILLFIAMLFLIYPNHAAAQQNKQESSAAIETLIKAAEQGDAKSQFELAGYWGNGDSQNYAEAARCKLQAGAPKALLLRSSVWA